MPPRAPVAARHEAARRRLESATAPGDRQPVGVGNDLLHHGEPPRGGGPQTPRSQQPPSRLPGRSQVGPGVLGRTPRPTRRHEFRCTESQRAPPCSRACWPPPRAAAAARPTTRPASPAWARATARRTARRPRPAPSPPRTRLVAFARCMRQHGVAMNDPTRRARQLPDHDRRPRRARQGEARPAGPRPEDPEGACRPARSSCRAASRSSRRPTTQRLQDAALEFARCMREHGIEVPDPKVGAGGLVQIAGGPKTASPKAQKIQQQCQQAFRSARGTSAPAGGTSRSGS